LDTGVSATSGVVRTLEDFQNERKTGGALGKDDFMKILVAQLSNQNPLEPTNDTEFIAQLAQFSSLEQMQSLNQGFARSQAYSLIGKTVYVNNEAEDGTLDVIYGKVDGVVRKDGMDYIVVNDEHYTVDDVTGVLDDAKALSMEQQILQSAGLIGKTVTASVPDENGEVHTVSGVVEKIMIIEGEVFAVVNGEEVPLLAIEEIADTPAGQPEQTEIV